MPEAIYLAAIFALAAWGGYATRRARLWKRRHDDLLRAMLDQAARSTLRNFAMVQTLFPLPPVEEPQGENVVPVKRPGE